MKGHRENLRTHHRDDTHTHTWLRAHARQTHFYLSSAQRTRWHTQPGHLSSRLHSLGDEFTEIKKRERWKKTNEKGDRTQEQQCMKMILEASKRKRMMQYNKVRVHGCEEELKRFKGVCQKHIIYSPSRRFQNPCELLLWNTKGGFWRIVLVVFPMQLQWKGTVVSKKHQKEWKNTQNFIKKVVTQSCCASRISYTFQLIVS